MTFDEMQSRIVGLERKMCQLAIEDRVIKVRSRTMAAATMLANSNVSSQPPVQTGNTLAASGSVQFVVQFVSQSLNCVYGNLLDGIPVTVMEWHKYLYDDHYIEETLRTMNLVVRGGVIQWVGGTGELTDPGGPHEGYVYGLKIIGGGYGSDAAYTSFYSATHYVASETNGYYFRQIAVPIYTVNYFCFTPYYPDSTTPRFRTYAMSTGIGDQQITFGLSGPPTDGVATIQGVVGSDAVSRTIYFGWYRYYSYLSGYSIRFGMSTSSGFTFATWLTPTGTMSGSKLNFTINADDDNTASMATAWPKPRGTITLTDQTP